MTTLGLTTRVRLASVRDLSAAELRVLAAEAGAERMGRLCHLVGPEMLAQVRSAIADDARAAFERTLTARTTARLCFAARNDVLLVVEGLLRARAAHVLSATMSAGKAIEKAHAAVVDLLVNDESTKLMSGTQRKTLGEIATLLAAAHGELWMSGGTEERARERLQQAFDATVTLNRSSDLPRPAFHAMSGVQDEIVEAGRLLGIDLTL
jgi:hypothetical protein